MLCMLATLLSTALTHLSARSLNKQVDVDLTTVQVCLDVVVVGYIRRGKDDALILRGLEMNRYVIGVGDQRRTLVEYQVLYDVTMKRHQRSIYSVCTQRSIFLRFWKNCPGKNGPNKKVCVCKSGI